MLLFTLRPGAWVQEGAQVCSIWLWMAATKHLNFTFSLAYKSNFTIP